MEIAPSPSSLCSLGNEPMKNWVENASATDIGIWAIYRKRRLVKWPRGRWVLETRLGSCHLHLFWHYHVGAWNKEFADGNVICLEDYFLRWSFLFFALVIDFLLFLFEFALSCLSVFVLVYFERLHNIWEPCYDLHWDDFEEKFTTKKKVCVQLKPSGVASAFPDGRAAYTGDQIEEENEKKWEKIIEWGKMRKCSSLAYPRLRVWLRPYFCLIAFNLIRQRTIHSPWANNQNPPPPPLGTFACNVFWLGGTLDFRNLVVCNFVGGGCARYGIAMAT